MLISIILSYRLNKDASSEYSEYFITFLQMGLTFPFLCVTILEIAKKD